MVSWIAAEQHGSNGHPEREGSPDQGRRLDPTMMTNQPALRVSSGRVWLIMGAIFAAVSLIPFALLIFSGEHPSRGVAIATAVTMLGLYGLMLIARFAIRRGPGRLRLMAASMLAMAAVGVLGGLLCVLIENAAI